MPLAIAVAACASPATTQAPTIAASPFAVSGSPDSTTPPWPAAFAAKFCIAVGEHSIFVDDLGALQSSLNALQFKKAGQHALTAQTDVQTMQLALSQAPKWAPAADVVRTWRAALDKFDPALKHIRQGANRLDTALLKQGGRELKASGVLLGKATPKVDSFIADTGFTCG